MVCASHNLSLVGRSRS